MSSGKVFFVGAGPGDPKLLTLRGKEAIECADVIVYDRLASPRLLRYRKPEASMIFVGKHPDHHLLPQAEINELLVHYASQGKIVTRLKGGDPSVFGRVAEEAEFLVNHQIAFEIVPGVSSAIAVPLYAGIPVTHRELSSSIAILTGHEYSDKANSTIDWAHLAQASGTQIFLMAVANIEQIASLLMTYGKPNSTPVAVIRWGTTSAQQTITSTLQNISVVVKQQNIQPPAILIIGKVVALREKLNWYESKPLFSKKIIVTRAAHQASELIHRIEEAGGEAIAYPVISIHRMKDPIEISRFDELCQNLEHIDWLIFTSANGVDYFIRELRERKLDLRRIAKTRIAVIGPKTYQAVVSNGLFPDFQAETFHSEGLRDVLAAQVQVGQRVCIPTANLATSELADQLRSMGLHVTQLAIYQNQLNIQDDERAIERLHQKEIDIITFTSSSTIHYFMQALLAHGITEPQTILASVQLACIGNKTATTLKQYGLSATYVAPQATIASLVQRMITWQCVSPSQFHKA